MHSRNVILVAINTATLLLFIPSFAMALVVNIDVSAYESHAQANRQGTNYVGQGAYADPGNDYWNQLTKENLSLSGLVASDGATGTSIGVSINSAGAFVDTVITNHLLSDYFYGATTTTVSGLEPNAEYTVYVYAVGDQPGQGSTITIGSDVQTTTGDNVNEFVIGGNYVVFVANADSSGEMVMVSSDKINGFQIIGQVPEPAYNLVHPGMSHKLSDLDRMKAMVDARIDPWYTSYQQMAALGTASYDYTVRGNPTNTVVYRNSPYTNKSAFESDSRAAYYNALRWYIEGDTRYAEKAVECINVWNGLTYVQARGTEALTSNMIIVMLEAAELIRHTYSGWSAADIQAFSDMLVYPGYSDTTIPADLSTQGTWYWRSYKFDPIRAGNQELCAIRTCMAIGIFLDNPKIYDRAYRYVNGLPCRADDIPYPMGPHVQLSISDSNQYRIAYNVEEQSLTPDFHGDGMLTNYVWETGQCQESSRDQGHTTFGLGILCHLGELTWNQGDNLWGAFDDRLLLGLEYTLRYNVSYATAYPDQPSPWEPTVASGEFIQQTDATRRTKSLSICPVIDTDTNRVSRGNYYNEDTWELPVAHFVGRGLFTTNEARWTVRARDTARVINGEYESGPSGGAYLGFGGLTYARPNHCYGDPVSGFTTNGPAYSLHQLPGTLEAELYDYSPLNGEGRTFHDTTPGNSGGAFRSDGDVDVAVCSEGGYALTDLEDGEWVSYTVNIPSSTNHSIAVRYAAAEQAAVRVSLGGVDVTGDVILPATGGSNVWATYTIAGNLQLPAGVQGMRVYFSNTSESYRFKNITFTQTATVQRPSTHIEAEDCDASSGVKLNDPCSDEGGGNNVGSISDGDWCRYDGLTLGTGALFSARVARPSGRPAVRMEIRTGSVGGTLIGSIDVPVTGGWQVWTTESTVLDPVVGSPPIYVVFVQTDSAAPSDMMNFNWFELVQPETPTGLGAEPATATQIDLAWNATAGASGYNLKRGTTSGGPYEVLGISPAGTNFTDSGLLAGTNYYYVVSALYSGTESADSLEVSAVPSAPLNESAVVIGSMDLSGLTLSLIVTNSGLGHNFQAWSTDRLVNPDWQPATGVVAGNGGALQVELPVNPADTNRFYKLEAWRQ